VVEFGEFVHQKIRQLRIHSPQDSTMGTWCRTALGLGLFVVVTAVVMVIMQPVAHESKRPRLSGLALRLQGLQDARELDAEVHKRMQEARPFLNSWVLCALVELCRRLWGAQMRVQHEYSVMRRRQSLLFVDSTGIHISKEAG
jgi:uncharacterized membrane protein YidH (DUF202 family)